MDLHLELKRQLARLELQVDDSVSERLIVLLEELLRWNKTYNLTSITDRLEAVEKHLVDSLTILPYLHQGDRLLDIGSGGGFPSLPIKFVRPDVDMVSVDSVAKKIRFQKHVIRKFGLSGYEAWHGRAEDLPNQKFAAGGFDLIVARAFSSLEKLVDLALPCLRPSGRIIAMKGPEGDTELNAAANLLDNSGLQCRELIKLQLPASGADRRLLILAS